MEHPRSARFVNSVCRLHSIVGAGLDYLPRGRPIALVRGGNDLRSDLTEDPDFSERVSVTERQNDLLADFAASPAYHAMQLLHISCQLFGGVPKKAEWKKARACMHSSSVNTRTCWQKSALLSRCCPTIRNRAIIYHAKRCHPNDLRREKALSLPK